MNTTIRNGISKANQLMVRKCHLFVMLCLTFVFSAEVVYAQPCLSVEKRLVAVAPAASNTLGNMDVTFSILVTNPCLSDAMFVQISDNAMDPGNLGSAFVQTVGLPVIAYVSPGSSAGSINFSFDGGGIPELNNGLGILEVGDSIIMQFTVEVDVDAIGAPSPLQNQAFASHGAPVPTIELSNIVDIPNCWTNCQMACNNLVQVSVNSMCEAEILAEMILEGEYGECAELGFFQVTLYDGNTKVNMPLDKSYINKKLRVNVRNIVCNNNCWGYLVVEDKTPPVLNCRERDTISCAADVSPLALGFPVPIQNVNLNVYPYIVSGLDACGTVTLRYTDSLVKYDCNVDSLSATIYRKWCATDPGGYQACCYDTIDLRRGTLADITFPPNYDGQPGNEPYLTCYGNWSRFPNGFPDTTDAGTGKPEGIYCGNIQYDFSDDTIQVCPGTYKLLRRWVILDWCNPGFRIDRIQQIKVVDDQPPAVTCPSNFTVSTNPWSCTGTLILPVPQDLTPQTIVNNQTPYVIENCSGWTYSVAHLPAIDPTDCTPVPGLGNTNNVTKLPDGRYQVSNMPLGCNWIYYRVTDGCGNSTVCQFDIEVKDLTPPVAVCHEKTVISLGSNGLANVPATVFNDHSHDNCGSVKFRVRRMNPGPCGTTTFRTTQDFCCADVQASPVRMVLEVSDENNNTSICMVDAYIQDKIPPKITCPADRRVDCNTDLSNLNVFGMATATDNCQVTIQTRVYNNLNSCKLGTIIREFIAVDPGGLRDSCQQTITVYDANPFNSNDIIWPTDRLLDGCSDIATPEVTGKPVFLNKDNCNQPISSFEDLKFNYVEGVCYKILRKWTVIDWCTYNAINQTGIWYRTQVIKINNTEGPSFTSSCANRELCITENCALNTNLEATATDNCTLQEDLRWTYKLDLNNDNSVNFSGNRNKFNTTLPEGTHKITWTVEDQCGNISTCMYLIHVRDCKKPTPYCRNGLITVLMQNNATVTLWAKDFNLASEDNCTAKPELKFSFTNNPADSFKVYSCSDIANGISDTVDVFIYVTDKAGNQDVCKTTLILQDNQNVCPDVPNFGGIGGYIRSYGNSPSPQVMVYVSDNALMNKELMTDQNGSYMFHDLNMYKDYTLKAKHDVDPLNGVSTKDIVKIQRHILGLELFDNPYRLIAADVNRSGNVTARDISELRKLILGVQNNFENNESWVFVNASQTLTMDKYFEYSSTLNVDQLNVTSMDNDFVSVKTGDVTGEANTGLNNSGIGRSVNTMVLGLSAVQFENAQEVTIPVVNSMTSNIAGLQLALSIDETLFEFINVKSGALELSPENYSFKEGSLRISWNDNHVKTIAEDAVLFSLILRARKSMMLTDKDITLDNQVLKAESYHLNGDKEIELIFKSNSFNSEDEYYELYQNVPNPFREETNVYFKSNKQGMVSLKLFDLSGRILKEYSIEAQKGMNVLKIRVDEIPYTGVLYMKLEAGIFNSTKKMIIIN